MSCTRVALSKTQFTPDCTKFFVFILVTMEAEYRSYITLLSLLICDYLMVQVVKSFLANLWCLSYFDGDHLDLSTSNLSVSGYLEHTFIAYYLFVCVDLDLDARYLKLFFCVVLSIFTFDMVTSSLFFGNYIIQAWVQHMELQRVGLGWHQWV